MRTSTNFTHGASGYVNYGCGCDICKEGHRLSMAKMRAKRFARTAANGGVAPIAVHNNSTYTNWGCHCDPCSNAHALLASS
jgi:hypothetical protein